MTNIPKAAGLAGALAERWDQPLATAMQGASINTPRRMSHFIAQVGHESGGFARVVENLNYKVEALLSLFGRHRISEADARKYGRIDGKQAANQEAIANCIYGGAWGGKNLGNTQPGDGWKFRGRSLIQVTGRSNYEACGKALGLDLINHPELLERPENAARAAAWFWSSKGLNKLADNDNIKAITAVINGGDNGLTDRIKRYDTAIKVLA